MFFLTCKEGLNLTAAELRTPFLMLHDVLAFLPSPQPSYCMYILNCLATIETANYSCLFYCLLY